MEAGVLKQIDELVKEQVAAQLPSYFPNGLQEQLDRHMLELDEVNRALHNSLVALAGQIIHDYTY